MVERPFGLHAGGLGSMWSQLLLIWAHDSAWIGVYALLIKTPLHNIDQCT